MQHLNPSEISELIKSRITDLNASAEARNEGTIVGVSDELHGATWDMGFATQEMRRGMMKAGRVALHAALTLAGIQQEG